MAAEAARRGRAGRIGIRARRRGAMPRATESPSARQSHGVACAISITACRFSAAGLVELSFGVAPSATGSAGPPPPRSSGTREPMIRPVLTEIALFLAPFVVYAVFLWATRAGVLHPDSWSPAARCLAGDRGARADDRQLHRAGAVGRLAAGLDLCSGPYRGRPVRAGRDEVTNSAAAASMPHGSRRRRCATCSPRSTVTARRRASSAARCATRCSASRTATSTSPPPRCRTR